MSLQRASSWIGCTKRQREHEKYWRGIQGNSGITDNQENYVQCFSRDAREIHIVLSSLPPIGTIGGPINRLKQA